MKYLIFAGNYKEFKQYCYDMSIVYGDAYFIVNEVSVLGFYLDVMEKTEFLEKLKFIGSWKNNPEYKKELIQKVINRYQKLKEEKMMLNVKYSDIIINIKYDDLKCFPRKVYSTDAGFDLVNKEKESIGQNCIKLIDSGITIAIPDGYCGFIVCRSSMAFKRGLTVYNAPGIIDSSYRGKVYVMLHSTIEQQIEQFTRIAQLLIIPVPIVTLNCVNELDKTKRDIGGIGSTGEK